MNINYRKATKKDLKSLYKLAVLFTEFNTRSSGERDKFFYESWEQDFEDEIRTDLASADCFYFIAEDENKNTIGYILGRNCPNCKHFLIEEFFVREDFRKSGVGKRLFELTIVEGKKFTKNIKVEIFNWNEDAKKFYLKHGFKINSTTLEL